VRRATIAIASIVVVAAAVLGPATRDDAPRAKASTITKHPELPLESIVAGSILVRASDGRAVDVPGAHRVRVLADGTERWDFDLPLDAAATLAVRDALAQDPSLRVDVDLWREAQIVPDDPQYPSQWALAMIDAEHAWDVETGDPQLVVAVVDTGVISDHPDLQTRLIGGYDFITDPGNAGDGDGRDDDPYDAGDESESSSGFHGTHISGIIAAASGNGVGIAGVDWRCRLQPVRVLGVDRHRGKDSDIADGIRWAAGLNVPGAPQNQNPAKVINLSFGGPGYSQLLQDAVLAAKARGSLIVASAGNDGADAIENVPGALEGVLDVAAASHDGSIASYSNYGPRVDLLSPGGSSFLDAPSSDTTPGAVLSTSYLRVTRQPVFAYAAGTSQAAAYASGVAALVRAAAPALEPDVAAAVMRRATVPPPGGCEQGCGDGLLNAARAVQFAQQIAVAECGSVGCGDMKMQPAGLKPEEGCTVSRTPSSSPSLSSSTWLLVVAAALVRLRPRSRSHSHSRPRSRCRVRPRSLLALLALAALSLSCSSKSDGGTSTGQSIPPPPTVRITDPIPTLDPAGDLVVSVGPTGRTLTVQVTPTIDLETVELHAVDPPEQSYGKLAHEPFQFSLPSSAPGESGERHCCVTAVDAHGQIGETCFLAVP
jgi:subtilisin family serine protease